MTHKSGRLRGAIARWDAKPSRRLALTVAAGVLNRLLLMWIGYSSVVYLKDPSHGATWIFSLVVLFLWILFGNYVEDVYVNRISAHRLRGEGSVVLTREEARAVARLLHGSDTADARSAAVTLLEDKFPAPATDEAASR